MSEPELVLPDEVDYETRVLIDWVNGKNITADELYLLVSMNYLTLTEKAKNKLREFSGAIHF